MKGTLYGIGIGPGDPDLLTIKAYKLLCRALVLAVPVKKTGEHSTALDIVKQVVHNIEEKEILELEFPMEHSRQVMQKSHEAAADRVCAILDSGIDVMMITLGDVSLYSTGSYVMDLVRSRGYEVSAVPGIPSFCDGAARAGTSLVRGHENLAILSSGRSMQDLKDLSEHFESLVLMKAGSHMPEITRTLDEADLLGQAVVASNVGMDGEYIGPICTGRSYGYFTTVIVHADKKKGTDKGKTANSDNRDTAFDKEQADTGKVSRQGCRNNTLDMKHPDTGKIVSEEARARDEKDGDGQ